MAHNNFPNGINTTNNNNRRMDNYEYEINKIMEQERRSIALQVSEL